MSANKLYVPVLSYVFAAHFRASSEGSDTKGDSRVSVYKITCKTKGTCIHVDHYWDVICCGQWHRNLISLFSSYPLTQPPSPSMVDSLFRFAVPLLKSDCSDIREAVIIGLGRTSPCSYRWGLKTVNLAQVAPKITQQFESVKKLQISAAEYWETNSAKPKYCSVGFISATTLKDFIKNQKLEPPCIA